MIRSGRGWAKSKVGSPVAESAGDSFFYARTFRVLLEIQIFRIKCKARGAEQPEGLLGSDANFIAMQSIAPAGGRAKGTMNLDSDPKNPASTAQRSNSPEK